VSTTIERQRTTDTASGRTLRSQPGEPFPLGATTDARGTNFSIFSEVADRVELCLFDADGRETRVDLPRADGILLARVSSRDQGRSTLWVSRPRPVGTPGAPVQPGKAPG
jgi:pullulanase/glycogen debranching enzyme